MKSHSSSDPGLLLVAPALFLVLLGGLSVVLLAAWSLRRQDAFFALGERARRRLDRGRVLPLLWGLSAGILIVAAGTLLIKSHVLALFGFLLWAAGLCLAGGGLTVTAWAMGEDLGRVGGGGEETALTSLRLGLWSLFLATWLPFVGPAAVLLAGATGLGALLEILLTRKARGEGAEA